MADTQNQEQGGGLIGSWQITPGLITPRMLAATPTIAAGDTYYSDGKKFIRLPVTNNATLTVVAGVPVWQAGYSGTITTAKLTVGGANGSMTFVNGVLTAQVAAT